MADKGGVSSSPSSNRLTDLLHLNLIYRLTDQEMPGEILPFTVRLAERKFVGGGRWLGQHGRCRVRRIS